MGCFVTNDRRKRGNWQGFYFLRVSMVGSVGQSVGDLFETENDMNLLEMVNSFENLWIWFELGCFNKLEFLINSVLIPSSMWIKNLKNALGNQQSMTEIIRVAERCARKNQTNLDSNSTQTSLKNVEKVGCAWNFDWNVSKLVEKIIFGFKTRRRVIENGLKQVKLGNNSGFPVSFERWMKFYQK